MTPFAHGRLAVKCSALLLAWGETLGCISVENATTVGSWAGDARRSLPDIGFWSFARLRAADQIAAQVPDIAPDLAVEIVAPTDAARHLAAKVKASLAAGTTMVLIVDPKTRTLAVRRRGRSEVLAGDATFSDAAFPGLQIALPALFGILDRR